jgi:AraC-like DNA-binding protein
MHANPARPWTVAALASEAGLSRTAFAIRFRRIVGRTPIAYLTRLRMLLAVEKLRRPRTSTAQVAEEVGYTSESAFNVAFKRTIGRTPRRQTREAERTPARP